MCQAFSSTFAMVSRPHDTWIIAPTVRASVVCGLYPRNHWSYIRVDAYAYALRGAICLHDPRVIGQSDHTEHVFSQISLDFDFLCVGGGNPIALNNFQKKHILITYPLLSQRLNAFPSHPALDKTLIPPTPASISLKSLYYFISITLC